MTERSTIAYLFQLRWPGGFVCPRCKHREYYAISTRRLPLYQCKLCHRQTSVTSGTVMDKTRTPLKKWIAAIELLSSTGGINAAALADAIGITHKVAWTMQRKFREAIARIENDRKLEGCVYAGTWAFAPKYIWMFLPDRYYRGERVVCLFSGADRTGNPSIKMVPVSPRDLEYGMKQLTREGKRKLLAVAVAPEDSHTVWMGRVQLAQHALMSRFEDAKRWLNEQFHGIGSAYLDRYVSEFCFRWNVAARGASLRDEWYKLCFPRN